MANSQDQSFISQFNTEVKLAYALGSQLMPVVRKHTNVVGSTDRFQKIGNVAANTKSRNAALTFLDAAHSYVDVTLADAYVPLLVDKLDELKTNIDMQKEYSSIIATALGKSADTTIITAATAGSTTITTTAGGLTYAKVLQVVTYFNNKRVPMGNRNLVIGATDLAAALDIDQFTSADYNTLQAVMKGEVKQALGLNWVIMPDDMIPTALNVASCFAFDTMALGVSIGQEPKTQIDWNPERFAHQLVGTLSMGAAIVDGDGIVEVPCARA